MKKLLIILSICCAASVPSLKAQGIFVATGGSSSFFSETPVENIDAHTTSVTSVLNTNKNEVLFTVPMRTYKFKKSLMEEHFNEKYVESEKYPNASFKGTINETIDWTKDGVYSVTATGVFNLHGVEKTLTESGKLIIKDSKITLESNFIIKLVDYKIEVPKLVASNIAEEIPIKLSCLYQPYQKKN